ncbi:hypothetical protein LAZ67_3004275, partial [Cordylochernes scorpioides]
MLQVLVHIARGDFAAASPYAEEEYLPCAVQPAQRYKFGYDIHDDYGNKQYRHEETDEHGAVRGSYGFTDAHGIYREVYAVVKVQVNRCGQVEYVADKFGYRAWVKTNEPGTSNQSPADVEVKAKPVEPAAEPAYAHLAPQYAPDHRHAFHTHSRGYLAPQPYSSDLIPVYRE